MEEEDLLKEDAVKDREATMKRVVQTRAMLCPVCRWDKDPLDRDTLRMEVSLINRRDLRFEVLCSGISPGRCALFLETVMHIHIGFTVFLRFNVRMLCGTRGVKCIRSDREQFKEHFNVPSLIQCRCVM